MIPKYKAWDKESRIVRNVVSINFATKVITCDWKMKEVESCTEMYDKHLFGGEYKLLQSTGLKDKNGVEIYDKYIVRDSYGDVFLIDWLESCFILTESYGDYDHSFLDDLSFYEVVGNQFEHPHLLGSDGE